MARFVPSLSGSGPAFINVDRVDYFRIAEMPDRKWVTAAVFGPKRQTIVATHDTEADATESLRAALEHYGVLGG